MFGELVHAGLSLLAAECQQNFRHKSTALRHEDRLATEARLHTSRECCSAARQHSFAGAPLLNLRRVEHVLRGTPASLFGRFAYETPPRRARSLRGTPHHFAVATPTKPRRAERVCFAASPHHFALLRIRLSAEPSMLLCSLAGSGHDIVLTPSYPHP